MHSIVLVATCLACAGHARRAQTTDLQHQVKHAAGHIAEKGDVTHIKKLATLLLASSSTPPHNFLTYEARGQNQRKNRRRGSKLLEKTGGSSVRKQASPELDNAWGLGDEKGRSLANPIPGRKSQAEEEFYQKQQKMVAGRQTPPKYSNSWGLSDEKGRNMAKPIAGRKSQAEEEFFQKQQRMSAVRARQAPPKYSHSWGLSDEKGRNMAKPIAGRKSQAEEEFYQKQQKMAAGRQALPKYSHSWGLSDEKGRDLARPIAGTHSQAEAEFLQKQEQWRRR